jgi:hypothetical protein
MTAYMPLFPGGAKVPLWGCRQPNCRTCSTKKQISERADFAGTRYVYANPRFVRKISKSKNATLRVVSDGEE